MFVSFFYNLKEAGVPVSPTSFLMFHKAMSNGLVNSVDDFYIAARTVLIKSEMYFDLYDQVFSHVFEGAVFPSHDPAELDFWAHSMLEEWLKDPKKMAKTLGADEKKLSKLSPEELLEYFNKRLEDQKSRHDGGSKWIGTGGNSPVGHSGYHPGGMRVGGVSGGKSATQVASERRYRDYSSEVPLTSSSIGEALKKLKNLVPKGVKDNLNIDASICQTMKNGGEIEIVFDHGIVDKLKVILAIDNGGWSMEPYVNVVQALFTYSRSQFKDLKTCFFHNTVYDYLWEDTARQTKPLRIDDFSKYDPDTRLIIVGDASMAPYELMVPDSSIYSYERSGKPSIDRLKFLAHTFVHRVWLNPVPEHSWEYIHTIRIVKTVFPMFELTLDGLEKATSWLMRK